MLKIKKEIYEKMVEHTRNGLPLEVCGYLGEKDDEISVIRRMKNIDESNEHFSFDPKEQFEVVKEFRDSGLKAKVVYHSHPETASRPSEEDIKLAYDPNVSYIIISLAQKDVVVKSFLIKDDLVKEEKIEII